MQSFQICGNDLWINSVELGPILVSPRNDVGQNVWSTANPRSSPELGCSGFLFGFSLWTHWIARWLTVRFLVEMIQHGPKPSPHITVQTNVDPGSQVNKVIHLR